MQTILLEKVANLGQLGDIVKVKDGYARNFLILQGKAKRATEANLKEFSSAAPSWKSNRPKPGCRPSPWRKLEGAVVVVAQKAGVDGRLFWFRSATPTSLTPSPPLAGSEKAFAPAGRPVQAIGEYDMEVALHHDVVVTITLQVTGAA